MDEGWRLHRFSGQRVPLFVTNLFPHVKLNFICFNLHTLPFVLSVVTTEKNLASVSSFPPIRCFYIMIKPPPTSSVLEAEESQLSQALLIPQMLEPLNHL